MTDPAGKVFISYRRSPARPNGDKEAALVCEALRRAGVPTWRDVDDLPHEPTEDALVDELDDPSLSGAILLVSPEVESSPIVTGVEATRIFRRVRAREGFWVLPVLIGLDYDKAETVLGSAASPENLSNWNMHKIGRETIGSTEARSIAQIALKKRIQAIGTSQVGPLSLGVFTRHSPTESFSLAHDFSADFDGRMVVNKGGYTSLENSLLDGATQALETLPSPQLVGKGVAPLPLGVLVGAIYSPKATFDLTWLQPFKGQNQRWSLDLPAERIPVEPRNIKGDPSSEDLVLAIGISADIEHAVAQSLRELGIAFRALLHCSPKSGSYTADLVLTPEQGIGFVWSAIRELRNLREDLFLKKANLHLFLACPLAMAVLLGQQLNTFSSCHLYEHIPEASPSYCRVHSFQPSSLEYK